MRWSPRGKELRRIRKALGWTQKDLARRAKVGLKTVTTFESAPPDATSRADTVTRLAGALTTGVRLDKRFPEDVRATGILPDAIAAWCTDEADPATAATSSTRALEPLAPAPPPPSTPRAAKTGAATETGDDVPPLRSLAERAAIERKLGLHALTVRLPSGAYPLLGAHRLKLLDARFADFEGEAYAVSGTVRESKRITGKPARVLKAERGRGAVMACLVRTIEGSANGEHLSAPFHFTVFAPKAEHGLAILEMEEKNLPITVLARVLVRDYDEKTGWNGFFVFEKRPHPWPFALVVETVFPGMPPTEAKRSG